MIDILHSLAIGALLLCLVGVHSALMSVVTIVQQVVQTLNDAEKNELRFTIARLELVVRAFVDTATYPVAKSINPRGYEWRDEGMLDYVRGLGLKALNREEEIQDGDSPD